MHFSTRQNEYSFGLGRLFNGAAEFGLRISKYTKLCSKQPQFTQCLFQARFAINSVTLGDYNRPLQISKFVAELNAGFRLLNLKNDSLRKRFDALKYDVKKIEEVVYDLSIRGLTPGGAAMGEASKGPAEEAAG